jgi:hypothetical protein
VVKVTILWVGVWFITESEQGWLLFKAKVISSSKWSHLLHMFRLLGIKKWGLVPCECYVHKRIVLPKFIETLTLC